MSNKLKLAAAKAEAKAAAATEEEVNREFPPFCGIDGGEEVANDIAKAIRTRGKE